MEGKINYEELVKLVELLEDSEDRYRCSNIDPDKDIVSKINDSISSLKEIIISFEKDHERLMIEKIKYVISTIYQCCIDYDNKVVYEEKIFKGEYDVYKVPTITLKDFFKIKEGIEEYFADLYISGSIYDEYSPIIIYIKKIHTDDLYDKNREVFFRFNDQFVSECFHPFKLPNYELEIWDEECYFSTDYDIEYIKNIMKRIINKEG